MNSPRRQHATWHHRRTAKPTSRQVADRIEPHDVIELLLAACPSFRDSWLLDADDHADPENPGGRLLYLDAADFLRHLARLQVAGETDEFDDVFTLIERFVVEGDDYVSTLGVIGFLEGMQMETVGQFEIDVEACFRPRFGPVSEAWWQRLNRFWAGDWAALQVDRERIAAEAEPAQRSGVAAILAFLFGRNAN